MKRLLAVVVLSAISCAAVSPSLTAHANSAQSSWDGRDAFGAYVKEENCPVTVTGEKLTLRIPDFPQNYYRDKEEFLTYQANVTAEYTFFNPASYDVEMTLVFPFGRTPVYLYDLYVEEGDPIEVDDAARCPITADGNEIEKKIRFTLDRWTSDPAKDISRLSDVRRMSGNFSSDTPVAIYYYRQVATEFTSKSSFIAASFKGLGDGAKTKVLLERMSGGGADEESLGRWGDNSSVPEPFALYVIGEPLSRMPEWKVYENAACKKLTDGYVERVPEEKLPTEETTLGELFLSRYSAESSVDETDWFNAVFDAFFENETGLTLHVTPRELDVSERLMRWYEYKLSLPAGGSVVNSVTAPLYPDISHDYTPSIYSYTYLLSPASTWADFGKFELNIETPYYITESSLELAKTEIGYSLSQNGLPAGELTFTMSTSEHPEKHGMNYGGFLLGSILSVALIYVAVAGTIIAVTFLAIHFAKKKKR